MQKNYIEIGKIYKNWLVLKEDDNIGTASAYLCECQCQFKTTKRLTSSHLLHNDLFQKCKKCFSSRNTLVTNIGDKFGRWEIVDAIPIFKDGVVFYLCRCDCKKKTERLVQGTSLKGGRSNCCGCLSSKSKWKGFGELSGEYFNHLKHIAKDRDLELDVDLEYLWNLFLAQNRKCALTGKELIIAENYRNDEQTASLDREDNNKGYIKGNVRWLHKTANKIKNIYTDPIIIYFCENIANPNWEPIDYKVKTRRRIECYEDIELSWWNNIKYEAAKNGREFSITPEIIWRKFVNQGFRCAISSVPIEFGLNVRNSKEGRLMHTVSLDRENSKIGYTEDNTQIVHKIINKMKSDLLQDEFVTCCKDIYQFNKDVIFV